MQQLNKDPNNADETSFSDTNNKKDDAKDSQAAKDKQLRTHIKRGKSVQASFLS